MEKKGVGEGNWRCLDGGSGGLGSDFAGNGVGLFEFDLWFRLWRRMVVRWWCLGLCLFGDVWFWVGLCADLEDETEVLVWFVRSPENMAHGGRLVVNWWLDLEGKLEK
ncbi:hypothetical protein KY289_020351 [Solanum tuberosum]|nr:hypothetical protein KY289_020351 [Solanum tuberosum]